jgi:predicted ATPase/DNA-binding CsgD family transcriptional regulator
MNRQGGALLPAGPGLLLGREDDLSRVTDLLHSGCWLVTLRGPGGIGKTALALHLAQWVQGLYDRVQFVDLSALRDPGEVLNFIALALSLPADGAEPAQLIRDFACEKRTLLILDNFEQLLPAAVRLAELKSGEGTLQIVVTSRSALCLHDEHEHSVGPLALPETTREATSSSAVQLFVRRVKASRPSFRLGEDNTAEVIRVCEILEGVPLALELAAARLRNYALPDLLTQLEHSLVGLHADFCDRPERLRSLRAAVQWSYDLMDATDRDVFECCSLFEGGFTPAALSTVWGASDVLERIESLLDQSFMQRLEVPETRWKMLQPLRELAAEHVADNPLVQTWRDRHARYFLKMIEDYIGKMERSDTDERAQYLPHYPNIRAGMIWVVAQGQADLAYRYLCTIGFFWSSYGLAGQEVSVTAQVLALPAPEDRLVLLRALEVSTYGLKATRQFEAAESRLREMLTICQELGDADATAMTLERGRTEQAWERVQRVLREEPERIADGFRSPRGRMNVPFVRRAAAECLLELGRYEEALDYATQALEYFHRVGNTKNELQGENLIGFLLLRLHRRPEALTLLLSCLRQARAQGFRNVVNDVLGRSLTLLAAQMQEWKTLVQFKAFTHTPSWESSQSRFDLQLRRDLSLARKMLGESGFQAAWAAGTRLQMPDAVELAERLVQRLTSEDLTTENASTHHLPLPRQSVPQQCLEANADIPSVLTPREWEVLALVALGHPDRRVARLLGISPGTASKHVSNLLRKLELRNRVELTRWTIEQGAAAPP